MTKKQIEEERRAIQRIYRNMLRQARKDNPTWSLKCRQAWARRVTDEAIS